jgi:hypothetical protein
MLYELFGADYSVSFKHTDYLVTCIEAVRLG